jgi:hypothetical protein
MDRLPAPTLTQLALEWLENEDQRLNRAQRALLRTIDGRRDVIELESVARALGLRTDALETLHHAGLIRFAQIAPDA